MDTIRDLNYTRLYYIALVIVPAGKGPIPHLTRLYPRLRAARCARASRVCDAHMCALRAARHYYMRRIEPAPRHPVIGHQVRHGPGNRDAETRDKEKKTRDIDTAKRAPIMRTHQGN